MASNAARVWDAATGMPIGEPMRQVDVIKSEDLSRDGRRLVTASGGVAQVWDAMTGAPIGQPMKHENTVTSAAFSPDGSRIVTSSSDKTARLWIAPPMAKDIVATACKMLADRNPTELLTRYGMDVKDPICTGDEPAPDPLRMIDR